MGHWEHRDSYAAHKRARAALLATFRPGQLCSRCSHPMEPGDQIDADHNDNGPGYRGLSHHSPCRTCGRRCNQSAGGRKAALRQGKKLRSRDCVICGKPYKAAMRGQVTCGAPACITAIRRSRKARHPDPDPPAAEGWVW